MDTLIESLRYERAALHAGEWWRLLTAHVVHLGAWHAVLNAAALALLWLIFRRDYTWRQWVVVVLSSIAAIDAGLWFLDPQIEWYVGASGVLHGIAGAGALSSALQKQREGWILAALLGAKLIYEQTGGSLPFAHGIPVVVDAHLYGAVGGLAAGAAVILAAAGTLRSRAQKSQ